MRENAMMIGKFARRAGVTPDTIRYYEREGLLKPARSENNYRVYGDSDLARMELIGRARASGFSLSEIRGLVELVAAGRRACGDFEEIARARLADLDEKIRVLQRARAELARTLESCAPLKADRDCGFLSPAAI